jgi:hypothetical protein
MTRESQVRCGGLAVAVAGLVVVFTGAATIGYIVMIVGFLISAWSRTIV